jgi:RNA-binding protein YlmH
MTALPAKSALNRLDDLANQAERRGYPTHTFFLTPTEQEDARAFLRRRRIESVLAGGWDGSERQVVFLIPGDWRDGPDDTATQVSLVSETIAALKITSVTGRFQAATVKGRLSHRDYLGSLLGLGIRRDQVGDILVTDDGATVFVLSAILPLVRQEWTQVGAIPVRVEVVDLDSVATVNREPEIVRMTAASLRLDKIASAGFNVSRTTMADWIRSGQVQLNWRVEQRPDVIVEIGDVISLRGHGRLRLRAEQGKSRKDRHILLLERY